MRSFSKTQVRLSKLATCFVKQFVVFLFFLAEIKLKLCSLLHDSICLVTAVLTLNQCSSTITVEWAFWYHYVKTTVSTLYTIFCEWLVVVGCSISEKIFSKKYGKSKVLIISLALLQTTQIQEILGINFPWVVQPIWVYSGNIIFEKSKTTFPPFYFQTCFCYHYGIWKITIFCQITKAFNIVFTSVSIERRMWRWLLIKQTETMPY